MFLFSKKHKTPVSTYTDSYRPPCSVKKTIQKQTSQQLCSENKFVTPGLMMPLVQNPASQGQTELPIKAAMQESHRNTINPTAYWPKKYWLARSKDKYKPVFVNKDKYLTWRTGPYNSTVWNRYLSCVPLPPKETRMETFLHSIPVSYPLKPTCINQCEREVATDMLPRLPMYSVTGRGPYWGYYSPCSGCHHCQQGMDYYVDGASAIRGQLHTLEERAVRSIPCCSYSPRATFCASTHRLWSFFLYRNLRWGMSHFKKTGGVQRDSYTILPEFTSEAYSAPCCWLGKFLGKGGETSAAIGLVGTLTALRGWYPATTPNPNQCPQHSPGGTPTRVPPGIPSDSNPPGAAAAAESCRPEKINRAQRRVPGSPCKVQLQLLPLDRCLAVKT
ncbi:sperm microtubule inner protein 6 [Strix uralensis]|uniref:sperm microtubule inner protein 6 n=1 Tax=Strix uralensis TaxID=36305 RepID=UPI003DA6D301